MFGFQVFSNRLVNVVHKNFQYSVHEFHIFNLITELFVHYSCYTSPVFIKINSFVRRYSNCRCNFLFRMLCWPVPLQTKPTCQPHHPELILEALDPVQIYRTARDFPRNPDFVTAMFGDLWPWVLSEVKRKKFILTWRTEENRHWCLKATAFL